MPYKSLSITNITPNSLSFDYIPLSFSEKSSAFIIYQNLPLIKLCSDFLNSCSKKQLKLEDVH